MTMGRRRSWAQALTSSYFDKAAIETGQTEWVYRMINNKHQLKEKMSLFWHTILCAGDNKVDNARTTAIQIDKFREYGMGNFKEMLMMLSTDPAMLYYLDNSGPPAAPRRIRGEPGRD